MVERVQAEVLIFVPAFNEGQTVAEVVRGVRSELAEADVLVVDDGSTDDTARRAHETGAIVATLPFNLGIGAAIQTGYLYARRHGYRFCAHLDADGQHRPEDVHRLLDAVREGRCDLAIGSRYKTPSTDELVAGSGASRYVPTFLRRVGTSVFRRMLSFVTRHHFTDTTSGLRAANRQAIELFSSEYAGDYPELESLHSLVRNGLRFEEIPVVMLPRAGGRSKFNAINSAFFIFKGLLVLFVGVLRRREVSEPERSSGP